MKKGSIVKILVKAVELNIISLTEKIYSKEIIISITALATRKRNEQSTEEKPSEKKDGTYTQHAYERKQVNNQRELLYFNLRQIIIIIH